MPILFFKGIRYPFAYGKVAILSLNLQVSECIIFMISSYVVNEGLFVSQNLTTISARMARRFQVLTLHVIIDIRTPFAGITAHGADPEARGGVLHHHPGYLGFQILTYKNPFIIFHQIFIFWYVASPSFHSKDLKWFLFWSPMFTVMPTLMCTKCIHW